MSMRSTTISPKLRACMAGALASHRERGEHAACGGGKRVHVFWHPPLHECPGLRQGTPVRHCHLPCNSQVISASSRPEKDLRAQGPTFVWDSELQAAQACPCTGSRYFRHTARNCTNNSSRGGCPFSTGMPVEPSFVSSPCK
jgi:hypothetical protein